MPTPGTTQPLPDSAKKMLEDVLTPLQPPPEPPPPRLIDKRTTYLLIPNSEHEDRIGRAYIESVYGDPEKLGCRIVNAIPVARLTDECHVIVVARRKVTPVINRQEGPSGHPVEYPVAIEQLVQQVLERDVIAIKDYWLDDYETGGRLNMQTFLTTLNQRAQPFCARHRGDEGLIRLFFL